MRRALDLALLIVGIGLAWQLAHEWAGDVALTSPRDTVAHAVTLLGSQRFWPNVLETAQAFVCALAISALGGVALGIALGAHRLSGEVAEPLLVALYAIPKITLYPLILLLFGLGLSAKVAFGAIHGIIPTALFAMGAVRAIAPVHRKTARALRLTPLQAAWTVWLPAALPEIVTGQRIGFSLTLLGVLIGEMFASQRGLGFLLMNAIGLNDVPTIMAITLMIAVVAVLANGALLALDRRLHR
ncbi:MAG: ABC transporter permease subunit [Alphaproteobacteria bacterium]|nr:ABC transporter permease subunit [Alphaproteobacteria bacterium]